MLSPFNIYSIALYEVKSLLRSWFFRIFSILAIFMIVIINIALFGTERTPTALIALPSFIPYLNILLINLAQAVIGGFLASDFLKYDSKLDTTDVIYMRSMTNAEYVLGKTLGVLVIFGILNIAAIINALVFNVFIADIAIIPVTYLLYPLLISIPTLVFIFGLSFFLMAIMRNQALTFILLLGYIAVTLFFIGGSYGGLFDYMAFNIPLTWSDFAGFADFDLIIMHRAIYTLLGISFIFSTVLLIKRLPQSRPMNTLSFVTAVACIIGAVTLGGRYIGTLSAGKVLREDMTALNMRETNTPAVTIESCTLDIDHAGDTIEASADIVFTNETAGSIDRYIFSLNPGLVVKSVKRDGSDMTFTRELHILSVTPSSPLAAGDTDKLVIEYAGNINEDACFVETDEEKREEQLRLVLYNIGKRYAFVGPRYVLMTPESHWYPVAGIPYGALYPKAGKIDFVDYGLTVRTESDLTAVSQGAVETSGDGTFVFSPETPLPCLSLAIGNYEKKSIEVDQIEYGVYILEGHDFFSEYFADIADQIPDLISDLCMEYEETIDMDYLYERFFLVETPAQFFSYPRLWTIAQETTLPEQILFQEKAIVNFSADFRQRSFWMERHMRRGNTTMTMEDIKSGLFRNFATSTFSGQGLTLSTLRSGMRIRTQGSLSLPQLFVRGIPNHYGSYVAFPLYYTHNYHFSSDRWPVFSTAIELYLSDRASNDSPMMRMFTGSSDDEKANLLLAKRPFMEILESDDDVSEKFNVLKSKSNYLFSRIITEVGEDEFNDYIADLLDDSLFESRDAEAIAADLDSLFDIDTERIIESVLNENELPAFMVSSATLGEFIESDRTYYHIGLSVTNVGSVDGLIGITVRGRGAGGMGGRGGGGGRGMMGRGFGAPGEEETTYYIIPANSTKEIGIVQSSEPGPVSVDTMISQNIPSSIDKRPVTIELDPLEKPFEGERIIDTPVYAANPGEIIIDNEDPGFETIEETNESLLKKMIKLENQEEDEYIGIRFWNMPRTWQATTESGFYGSYRLSAHYIRAGNGVNRAVWNADIPESGKYNVYYHTSALRLPMRGGPGRRRSSPLKDFNFLVYHDDGIDEVELDIENLDEDWTLLGTYYFSKGGVKVELTDETEGRLVYADAVRFQPAKR